MLGLLSLCLPGVSGKCVVCFFTGVGQCKLFFRNRNEKHEWLVSPDPFCAETFTLFNGVSRACALSLMSTYFA